MKKKRGLVSGALCNENANNSYLKSSDKLPSAGKSRML